MRPVRCSASATTTAAASGSCATRGAPAGATRRPPPADYILYIIIRYNIIQSVCAVAQSLLHNHCIIIM